MVEPISTWMWNRHHKHLDLSCVTPDASRIFGDLSTAVYNHRFV